jgi:hypothetical protein
MNCTMERLIGLLSGHAWLKLLDDISHFLVSLSIIC